MFSEVQAGNVRTRVFLLLIGVALTVGFLVGSATSTEPKRVHALEQELARARQLLSQRPAIKVPPFQQSRGNGNPAGTSPQRTDYLATNDPLAVEAKLSEELERRRLEGEYFLKHDDPLAKRHYEQEQLPRWVHDLRQSYEHSYTNLFGMLGLTGKDNQQLFEHVVTISRASIDTEQKLRQLHAARNDFDTKLKSLLSPEQYSQFRQAESQRPAIHELELMSSNGVNIPNDFAYRDKLLEAIAAAKAYSDTYYHGPFDEPPEIAVGTENVIKLLTKRRDALVENFGALRSTLADSGVPEPMIAVLESYYGKRIADKTAMISRVQVGLLSTDGRSPVKH